MDSNSTAVTRQARVLRILNCLQSGPGFNAKELASQLKVSRRTIFRDLNLIRSAGVQVFFDERHDGYRLSYQTQCLETPRFDEQELGQFVLMAHLSLLQGLPGFPESSRELAAKLLCAYPYSVRIGVTRLLNSCILRLGASPPARHKSQLLRVVFEAIRRQKQLRLVVDPQYEPTVIHTKFAPFRVELFPERWSVIGRSSVHRGETTFGMEVIHSGELTSESYDVPRGFRLRS